MKLGEIVDSTDWNEDIKKEFFLKLKKSPSNYSKAQHCIIKALNISSTGSTYNLKEALALIDYVFDNLANEQFTYTRALSVQGIIYEKYLRDYKRAYDSYTKWFDIGGNHIGYNFDRFRAFTRMSKFKFSEELMSLYQVYLSETQFPSKAERFWTAIGSAIMYVGASASSDAKRMARKALEIAYEEEPTLLQKMIFKHKRLPDNLDITEEEIKIINKIANTGK